MIEGYQAFFKGVDGDRDGQLSREEVGRSINAFIAHRKAEPTPLTNEDQLRHGYLAVFEIADSNSDGLVTLEEVLALPLRTFDCADADANGSLSIAEQEMASDRCSHLTVQSGS